MSAPARYTVFLKPAAERAFGKLAPPDRRRLTKAIDSLATNPRPSAVTGLRGEPGLLRIRVVDYRIIYTIHDTVLAVLVLTIGHRRDVYRRR